MARQLWTADRRIWLDADGAAVEDGDEAAARLLVTAGHTIPLEYAEALGLTGSTVKAKAVKPEQVEDKAVKGPAETKAKPRRRRSGGDA